MAAARTPATTQRISMGSCTLYRVTFTSVVTGDTWVSGIPDIVDCWAQCDTTTGTQTSAGINVAQASGTFTFVPGYDTQSVSLFVLAGGPS
jgi:hypothetical protein